MPGARTSRTPRALGYHGTSAGAAESIQEDGFSASQNQHDWLGYGVYFFQDAPRRAYRWAIEHHAGEEPAVVGAAISLEGCMDLLDTEWFATLRAAFEALRWRCQQESIPFPRQSAGAHRRDCAVINFAVNALDGAGHRVRSVRAVFQEGEAIFEDSALFDLAHVQIAVRNVDAIEEVWIEEIEDKP